MQHSFSGYEKEGKLYLLKEDKEIEVTLPQTLGELVELLNQLILPEDDQLMVVRDKTWM